jgi:hypothetical protein
MGRTILGTMAGVHAGGFLAPRTPGAPTEVRSA